MTPSVQTQGDIVATYHGIRVPAAPHLGPGMVASMLDGTYERREVDLALAHVPIGARVLELGAGSGLVGAVIAKNRPPRAMLSVEANPGLLPHIAALYAENGLTGAIDLRHGVVLAAPDAPDTVPFHVRGNFLGSSLAEASRGVVQTVDVPVLRHAALTADFPHDVLVMDIEGGELELLRHADLSGVRLLIAEFHRHIYGRDGLRECRALLVAKGFVLDEDASLSGVHVWRQPA